MNEHEVILVRHGQTEWSVSGKHTGRTDIPLTELGRRQADALSEMLGGRRFARVLASPLQRAWETMERAGYADVAVATDDLMEWDYGEYEGRRTDDIRVDVPGWSVWTHPIQEGESLADISARVDRVIAQAIAEDGPVALFAHGHLLRVLAARWIELPAATGRHLRLDTATMSVLGCDRENRVLRQWNESCHLRSLDPVT
ncbi:MAG: histidine phosphatase family protein [Myxococcota bacterium]